MRLRYRYSMLKERYIALCVGIVHHNDDVICRSDLLRRDSKVLTPILIDGRTTEATRDVEGVFTLIFEIDTLVFETLETRWVSATIGE